MEVTYDLTGTDVSHLFHYIRYHRSMMRPIFQVGYSIILIGAIVAAFLSLKSSNMANFLSADSLMILGVAATSLQQGYIYILHPLIAEWQAQRSLRQASHKTMRLSPEAVSVYDALGDVTFPWSRIDALVDDGDCCYVFFERDKAFAVPKRAFGSSTEVGEFFGVAYAYWHEAKAVTVPLAPSVSAA